MWKHQPEQQSTQLFNNFDKICSDSAGDSGFLSNFSGSNYSCSSQLSSNSLSVDNQLISNISIDPMRVTSDSGIEIDLNNSFNQLFQPLQNMCLNSLDAPNSQLKVSSEFTKLNISDESEFLEKQYLQKPWELYFAKNDDGDTLLHTAIVAGYLEASLSIINAAPHSDLLDILNDETLTALHIAVITNQPEIVRRLVVAGADLSIRNYQGNTALHLACSSGNLACAKAMMYPIMAAEKTLSLGKLPMVPQNLEQQNYNGQTCLHIAASKNHVELVKLLVESGADLESQELLAGRTPLHLALECESLNVVLYLVQECHPQLDALTYAGYTAYQIANCVDEKLANELVKYGATPLSHNNSIYEQHHNQQTSGFSVFGQSIAATRA